MRAITLGDRSGELELDQAGSISFAAALPAEPDGRLARKVAYALRGVGCRVDLHPPVIRLPSSGGGAVSASDASVRV